MVRCLSLLILVVCCFATVVSAGPVVADRPARTLSAFTVPAGAVQSELGYTHARRDGGTADRLGEWLVRWGVVRDFELRCLVGSVAWSESADGARGDGWTDSWLGLKWTSQRGRGPRPTAALVLGTSLPTGGGDFGVDSLQPEAIIAMDWALGGGVSLGSNVGWTWADTATGRFDRWLGSLVLRVDLGGRFGLFGEGYGYLREQPGGSATGYLDGGLTYRASSSVRLDARFGWGPGGLTEDWQVGVGLVWRRGDS